MKEGIVVLEPQNYLPKTFLKTKCHNTFNGETWFYEIEQYAEINSLTQLLCIMLSHNYERGEINKRGKTIMLL